jgi:hypothetical protein
MAGAGDGAQECDFKWGADPGSYLFKCNARIKLGRNEPNASFHSKNAKVSDDEIYNVLVR